MVVREGRQYCCHQGTFIKYFQDFKSGIASKILIKLGHLLPRSMGQKTESSGSYEDGQNHIIIEPLLRLKLSCSSNVFLVSSWDFC